MSTPMQRALRAFETIPGVVVEPVIYYGMQSYQLTMTDAARAVIADMMCVRPVLVERMISERVIAGRPLFAHRVTELPPEEGNQP